MAAQTQSMAVVFQFQGFVSLSKGILRKNHLLSAWPHYARVPLLSTEAQADKQVLLTT